MERLPIHNALRLDCDDHHIPDLDTFCRSANAWSMQKRPAKKKLPRDVNARAFAIGEMATSEAAPEPQDDGKNPAAVALGRLGGAKGGKARANKLTKDQRKAIAIKAANARWKGSK
jgi:hypothetical protein